MKKLLTRKNWYKKRSEKKYAKGENQDKTDRNRDKERPEKERRDETEAETVLFIPSTPGGELLKRLREADRKFREGTGMR